MRLSFSERRTGQQNPILHSRRPFAMCSKQQPTTNIQNTKKFSFIVHNYQIHLAKTTNICEIVLSKKKKKKAKKACDYV